MPQSVTHLEGATDPCCIPRYTTSGALTLTAVHPILSPTGPRCAHRLVNFVCRKSNSLTNSQHTLVNSITITYPQTRPCVTALAVSCHDPELGHGDFVTLN